MTVLYFLSDVEHGGETAFPVAGVDPYENDLSHRVVSAFHIPSEQNRQKSFC